MLHYNYERPLEQSQYCVHHLTEQAATEHTLSQPRDFAL